METSDGRRLPNQRAWKRGRQQEVRKTQSGCGMSLWKLERQRPGSEYTEPVAPLRCEKNRTTTLIDRNRHRQATQIHRTPHGVKPRRGPFAQSAQSLKPAYGPESHHKALHVNERARRIKVTYHFQCCANECLTRNRAIKLTNATARYSAN